MVLLMTAGSRILPEELQKKEVDSKGVHGCGGGGFLIITFGKKIVVVGLLVDEHGHRVRVATHSNFEEFVLTAGLDFYPLGGDPNVLAECVEICFMRRLAVVGLQVDVWYGCD
ncbi:hypothetical protein E3N88_18782 [Mikania micrantha]|uniref:Uncharacterized protein n=1 Tax=Mikania micrantha TaxID=192012 RepID=A0A5N6NLD6_9ASTR|nr:hypothetical protein E3N88_18782 [Mikania micrantha]